MAAYCPKCNYKLKITDWRPECPKCGVNVVYYGIEERLREEADVAEYHYAMNKPKYDRLKFSLIGHKLSVVRLVIGILPLLSLLLPMGRIALNLPFNDHNKIVNLVSIIIFFVKNGLDVDALSALTGSALLGKSVVYFAVSLVSLLLMAVVMFVAYLLLTLSAAPRGIRRNIAFPIVGMVLATVSFVSFILMVSSLNAAIPEVFTGTVIPVAYIAELLVFAAMIAVNVIYKKKGIQVAYTDVEELKIPYNERPSTIAKKKAQAVAEAEANA